MFRLFVPTSRLAALLILVWLALPAQAASRPAVRGEHGMVSSPEALATQAGVDVLRRGGTAVDAAVSVAFTLAVTYPEAGNLGGGGFLLYRTDDARHYALDFRERAPRRARPELFLDEEGRPIPGLSLEGGLAVGVPGSVAGLVLAHEKWGRLPWAELLRPAIRLAAEGFPVSATLARSLAEESERLVRDEEARSIFTRGGRPLREGERLIQQDLAGSLRRVARQGRRGFYEGATGAAIARAVQAAGGVLDEQDLHDYEAVLRQPLEGRYRGYRVVSFPPPSSGGVVLLHMLGMLERYDLAAAGFNSSRAVHLMAEVERRAYADRSRWLGDPDFVEVPVEGLLDPDYIAARAAEIRADRATPSATLLPGVPPRDRGSDTLHFSVADASGRVVALTTTLNTRFGTGIVASGTGILLNNEMDDFALAPGVPNTYGLLGGDANAVAPRKRPLSSMTPTIVEPPGGGPRPALVLGSPGGSRIITAVLQVLVNVVDHGMPLQEAVDSPRFHHQWQPDRIDHEPRCFPADVAENLRSRGHSLNVPSHHLGNVNAIGLDSRGHWLGAADPRRDGAAAGY